MFYLSSLLYTTPAMLSTVITILIYTTLTGLSFIIFNYFNTASLINPQSNNNQILTLTLFNLLFLLNLAGIPPLPGFFIKINLLVNIINYINIYLTIIIIFANFTIFYFYIKFYKTLYSYSKLKNINISKNILTSGLIFILIIGNFYPIYNVLTLFLI